MISVIILVYNTAPYLRRCFDSVLSQTYKELEIILVNDGSTDESGDICDEYSNKDSRIKVIHKPNGGLSSARNAGVEMAGGDWIGFVDSDDFIHAEMYEKLHTAALSNNAELSICGYTHVDEDGVVMGNDISDLKDEVLTGFEALDKLVERNNVSYLVAFTKLYNRKLFDSIRLPGGKITDDEYVVHHDDEYIVHHIFYACTKIATISDSLYFYVQRDNSTMGAPFAIRRLDGYNALYDRYLFFRKIKMSRHAKIAAREMCWVVLKALWYLDFKENKKEILPLYKQVFWILVKNFDLRAGLLFLSKHKWLLSFVKRMRAFVSLVRFRLNYARAKAPRIFMLATPTHGNLGDQAIVYAERQHFSRKGKQHSIVEVRDDDWLACPDQIAKKVKASDTIVIDGGGTLGTLWPHEDDKISDIITRFKDNEITIFPQTVWYDSSSFGKKRLERNRQIYLEASKLTIMLRDKASYAFMQDNFPNVNLVLTRDMVLSLKDAPSKKRENRNGVLLCLREDKEKIIPAQAIEKLKLFMLEKNIPFSVTTTVISKKVTPKTRNKILLKKFNEFASSSLVVTDRLHGMIFAAITSTPCIALDNVSGKVRGCYEQIKDEYNILFAENVDEILNYLAEVHNGQN